MAEVLHRLGESNRRGIQHADRMEGLCRLGLCALLFTDQKNWKLPYGRIQQAGMELEKCCAGAMLAALALALAIPVTAGVLAPGVLPYPKSEMPSGQVRAAY